MTIYALQFVKPSHDVAKTVRREVEKCIGEYATFYVSSNGDAEFANAVSFSLTTHGDMVWTTNNKEVAEKAAVTDTEWYNADASTPSNEYVGCLKVVELEAK